MNKDTLMLAIEAGQILRLVNSVVPRIHRWEVQLLARVRSHLDSLVANAVATQDRQVQKTIEQAHARVLDLLRPWNAEALLQHATGVKRFSFSELTHSRSRAVVRELLTGFSVIMEGLSPVSPGQALRGPIIRDFNSVVRNADWHPTVHRLKMQSKNFRDSRDFATLLYSHYGSRPGRQQVDEKLANLATGENPATSRYLQPLPRAEAPFYTVSIQVEFSVEGFVKHPSVKEVLDHTPIEDGPSGQPPLDRLLTVASKPATVTSLEEAERVAQERLGSLLQQLKLRQAALVEMHRQRTENSASEQALEALRGLDPAVLEQIRTNPDLLKKI